MVFLQETYSTSKLENVWRAEWGGMIYFNHGSKHSRGTTILFDCNLQVTEHNEIRSDDGRILIVEVDIDNEQLALVNINAPNKLQELQNFFGKLEEMLQSFYNHRVCCVMLQYT